MPLVSSLPVPSSRYANSLSGTEGFFQNEEAVLSCLSALEVASMCGASSDKNKGGGESEDDDMGDRGDRVLAAVRVQASAQLKELVAFLSDNAL